MTTETEDRFEFEGMEFRKLRLQRVNTYVHDAECKWYVPESENHVSFFETESERDGSINEHYYVKDVEKIEFRWLFGIKWKWDLPDYL